jgi:hypothetical protein
VKRTFRFRGKERPLGCRIPTPEVLEAHRARGMFHSFLNAQVPPTPAVTNYAAAAAVALTTMLGNGPDPTLPPGVGPVGDCVIAEDLHLDGLRTANAGAPWIPTTAITLAEYSAVTNYNPADPSTDQGTDPMALLTYRATMPYASGAKLLGAPAVDATSSSNLTQAIWLATGCFAFASLPDAWESEEDAGDTWDVAGDPNPSNGHGFCLVDIDVANGRVLVCTWGELVWLTFAAGAKYLIPSAGGGVFAMLVEDSISSISGKAGNGLELAALKAYLGVAS